MEKKWIPVSIATICDTYGIPYSHPSSHAMDAEYTMPFLAPNGAGIGLIKRQKD